MAARKLKPIKERYPYAAAVLDIFDRLELVSGTDEIIKWISVDDQLPDDEITVLCFHPALNEPVWLGHYDCGLWFTNDGMALHDRIVTHWAEMPAGPEASI